MDAILEAIWPFLPTLTAAGISTLGALVLGSFFGMVMYISAGRRMQDSDWPQPILHAYGKK